MKKFLSLVLALVMTMSLVTVSAGAKDFTDNSKINYAEAVDVMSAVKVIDGYADGSFNPSATLTRGAAAKIICNLILGPTTASALVADAAPYSDVPTSHTFAGYIAYCQKEGIISGYADGTFKPANTLTGYAFMKMLLGALGYDATVEGYTGANWSINVAKRAINIGLNDDLNGSFNGVKAVTREEACLYAFNMLQATMVEYDSTTNITVGGAQVVIAGSKAKDVENKGTTDGNIGDSDKVMQFAEKYFTDLKNYDVSNDFGQPATKWTLKAEKIGTYDKTADQVYHGKVELGDIYSDLNMSTKDAAEYYIDGAEQAKADVSKGNEDEVGVGNGAVTYVYHNDDTNAVTICTVNTYVGTVSKSVAATKSKDAYIVIDSESAEPTNWQNEFETDEKFEDDAVVLYTFSVSAKEIKSVKVAEKVSGELTKIVDTKSYNLDDTTYKFSKMIAYGDGVTAATMATKSTYNFYLDNDGHVIYVEEEEYVSDDYALVLAIESDKKFTDARVKLLKADGSTKTYDTDKDYTASIAAGDIVTWSYDEKEDEVTLKEVKGGTYGADYVKNAAHRNFTLTNSTAQILVVDKNGNGAYDSTNDTRVYANSKTVFVVKNNDGDYTVYTGIKNVPSIKGGNTAGDDKVSAAYYCKTNGMATVMFIDASAPNVQITSDSTKAIYLAGESQSKLITDKNSKVDYYEFNAVVDGEVKTVKVRADVTLTDNAEYGATGVKAGIQNYLYGGATYNADGIITSFSANTNTLGHGTSTEKLSGEYNVKLDDESWTVAEDAKIWTIDKDGKISAGSIKSVKNDDNDTFIYTAKDGEITNLFVQEVKDTAAPVVDKSYVFRDETNAIITNETGLDLEIKAATNSVYVSAADQIFLSKKNTSPVSVETATNVVFEYTYKTWDNTTKKWNEADTVTSTKVASAATYIDVNDAATLNVPVTTGDKIQVTLTVRCDQLTQTFAPVMLTVVA